MIVKPLHKNSRWYGKAPVRRICLIEHVLTFNHCLSVKCSQYTTSLRTRDPRPKIFSDSSSQVSRSTYDKHPNNNILTVYFSPSSTCEIFKTRYVRLCRTVLLLFKSVNVSANRQSSVNPNNSYVKVQTRWNTISPRSVAWRWILGLWRTHLATYAAFTSYRIQIKLEVNQLQLKWTGSSLVEQSAVQPWDQPELLTGFSATVCFCKHDSPIRHHNIE